MPENYVLTRAREVTAAFNREAHAKKITEFDFTTVAPVVEDALSDIVREDYLAAQKKLEGVQSSLRRGSYRYERLIEKAGMFSERKNVLKEEAEALKAHERDLSSLFYPLNSAAQTQAEKHAANDTDLLVAAAERVKRGATYDNRYTSPGEIGEYLVLAAKNQQRQEKLIREMAEKITALEEKLKDLESHQTLDKPKIRPPDAPGR